MKKERLREIGFSETVNLFVQPNLSPYNEEISFNCRQIRKKGIFTVLGFTLYQYL